MSDWRTHLTAESLAAHDIWARTQAGGGRLVLTGVDLSGAQLSDVNLRFARFVDCNLAESNLRGTDFTEAELEGCDLTEVDASDAVLHRAELRDCSLERANFENAALVDLVARGGRWLHAKLKRADLRGADLFGIDLEAGQLSASRFDGATLQRCRLVGANLTDVNLTLARCNELDLRRSLFLRAILDQSSFDGCGFSGLIGTPSLRGPVRLTNPDVSTDYDGSMIRDTEFFRERWSNPWDPPGVWSA